MGSAVYYGKIEFTGEEEAKEAFPQFVELCKEIYHAEEWWQAHRDAPAAAFWALFACNFPHVFDYLSSIEGMVGGSSNNPLAGKLDVLGYEEDVDNILLDNDTIKWHSEVWHFADWDPFMEYVKNHFKGVDYCGWLSDEYFVVR